MELDLNRINYNANQSKLGNLFLGFFEGLFLDGRVRLQEIEALIKWVEQYPDAVTVPHFEPLYQVLLKAAEDPQFLLANHQEVQTHLDLFKNSKYFKEHTCDVQRLHGVLAGLACDSDYTDDEVLALNAWLDRYDYLKDDPIYKEIIVALNHVRILNRVSGDTKEVLRLTLGKYIQLNNFGLPQVRVSSTEDNKNPDFYHGNVELIGKTICLTGASARYSKAEWKKVIESQGGIFKDDLTKTVDYLVICNKGNPHWAHMSYGRKFEQALKWQKDGANIRILTEDDFVKVLEEN
ncbi:BRCT domain-containing protein [Acinetobacter baumannii]|uniref:NAD-dependent DNA ligase n=2 Tax=Acinetobacter baumannii TaxID=470 RepID=A0A0D5YEA9_ACIBA|nr:BRCT domain-containing protein [Acinetobacter baumannii]AKA30324.1 NAD-dependent DNA ligase [Acinetobacter baumannii]ARG33060.1 NAD-dependent DNA ligase [Acinetobacter baumannii]ASF78677.1 DNA polymerase III subunit epsilon [Acinetobacter baumannii]AVN15747.1 NAD-dependent DNA ligase [Acinetobacter baumannii]AXB15974.1 NAD-dependent DNA ligase [Acinetobacter baumannii]